MDICNSRATENVREFTTAENAVQVFARSILLYCLYVNGREKCMNPEACSPQTVPGIETL